LDGRGSGEHGAAGLGVERGDVAQSPQEVRTSADCGFVQAIRDGVQIVVEEPRVDVERHRRRGVPERSLDRLHIGSERHRESGGCVPELVRRQARWSRIGGRAVEGPLSEPEDENGYAVDGHRSHLDSACREAYGPYDAPRGLPEIENPSPVPTALDIHGSCPDGRCRIA
jgi:hypothetical protein